MLEQSKAQLGGFLFQHGEFTVLPLVVIVRGAQRLI